MSLALKAKATPSTPSPSIYIGRQAHHYSPMTAAKWREFQHGAPQEFLINEVITDMADPCVVGEVNHLRAKMELIDTLKKYLRDTHHRMDEISKEFQITKQDLTSTMVRIKCANLHSLIQDQLKQSFPAPIHTSPKPLPLILLHFWTIYMPSIHRLIQTASFSFQS